MTLRPGPKPPGESGQDRALAYLLSRPNEWVPTEDIMAASGLARGSIGTVAQELRRKGYRIVGRCWPGSYRLETTE